MKNKRWEYSEEYNEWRLKFYLDYDEVSIAVISKDDLGDWILDCWILGLREEYIDDYNDHECIEVIQAQIEDRIYNHFMEEAEYYQALARKFVE